jgi:hypothetical protein
MKQLWLFCALLATVTGLAQQTDKVQVSIDKRMVVSKYTPGASAPATVIIKKAALTSATTITIQYTGTAQAGWKRMFTLQDSLGNEVLSFEKSGTTGAFTWPVNNLAALFKKHGALQLFTIALPADPKQAALVRVARFHLCTLSLK